MRSRIFVLVLFALWVAGIACGNFVQPTANLADPEEEYYRGIYDICLLALADPATCLDRVGEAYENDWYGQPSRGWEWPLPGEVDSAGQLSRNGRFYVFSAVEEN